MPTPLTLYSPAKINLFLRILRRRVDGYHELASLFQAIDLSDVLTLSLGPDDRLSCTDPFIPTDATNLVLKAADLFRRKTGMTFGLHAHIDKRIPIQAGLGGGSSNAATTLWGMNELCGRIASQDQLAAWSAEIGSDIPFFLTHGTAYCTGRGEVLRPLSKLGSKLLWIVKSPEGLSTPSIYGKLKANELLQRNPEEALEKFLKGNGEYYNDLEIPAFEIMPELHDLKKQLLNQNFEAVLMSGSGSAFFCIGDTQPVVPQHYFCKKASFVNRNACSWF